MKTHANGRYTSGHFPSVTHVVRLANHLSVVQTAVAAGKVAVAMALLSVPGLVAPVAVALVTFAVYNANNLTDLEEDAVNRPRCVAFVRRYRRAILGLCVLAIVAAVVLAGVHGGAFGVAVVSVPVIASVLYSVPILPGPGADRLKDVFAVNTLLVAGSWGVTVTLLPVAVADATVGTTPILVVATVLVLKTIVSVEVFNVRDVAGDRASGVSTLPASLGVPATRHVLLTLDVVVLATVVLAADPLAPAAVVAVVAVTAASMFITTTLGRIDAVDAICLAKDCEYLLLAALLVLTL